MKLFLCNVLLCLCFCPAYGGIFDFVNNTLTKVTKAVDTGANSMIMQLVDTAMDIVPTALRKFGAGSIPINTTVVPLIHPSLGVNLSFVVFNISLNGLDSLHRVGPANARTDLKNGSALVSFDGQVTNLRLNASMEIVTYWKIGTPLKISGNLGYGDAKVVLLMFTRPSPYAQLVSFKLTDIGNFTLEVEGLGSVLNHATQQLARLIFKVFKEQIQYVAELILKKEISAALTVNSAAAVTVKG